jgi:hypothetical protein
VCVTLVDCWFVVAQPTFWMNFTIMCSNCTFGSKTLFENLNHDHCPCDCHEKIFHCMVFLRSGHRKSIPWCHSRRRFRFRSLRERFSEENPSKKHEANNFSYRHPVTCTWFVSLLLLSTVPKVTSKKNSFVPSKTVRDTSCVTQRISVNILSVEFWLKHYVDYVLPT